MSASLRKKTYRRWALLEAAKRWEDEARQIEERLGAAVDQGRGLAAVTRKTAQRFRELAALS